MELESMTVAELVRRANEFDNWTAPSGYADNHWMATGPNPFLNEIARRMEAGTLNG